MPDAPEPLSRRASHALSSEEVAELTAWRERFRAGLAARLARAEALLEAHAVEAARGRLEAMRPRVEAYIAASTMPPSDPPWSIESGVAAYIRAREFWLGVERRNLATFDEAAARHVRDPLALWASFAVGGHRGRGGQGGRALPRDVALAAFRQARAAGTIDTTSAERDERTGLGMVGPLEGHARLRDAVRRAVPVVEELVRAALAATKGRRNTDTAREAVVAALQAGEIELQHAGAMCRVVWLAARELAPSDRQALEPRDGLRAVSVDQRWGNRVFWRLAAPWFLPTASRRFVDSADRHPAARRSSVRDAAILIVADVGGIDAPTGGPGVGAVRALLERD